MKNVYGLEEWELEKEVSNKKRKAEISISLKYPDEEQYVNLKPKKRIQAINEYYKLNLEKLIALSLFEIYTLKGTNKRPTGLETTVPFSSLQKLSKLTYINGISIKSIEYATKFVKPNIEVQRYFCVKMTVIIEIEGILNKKQDVEQRFVLIKAYSFDDAYKKIEKQKKVCVTRYLNTDGRFVRWRINSLDDCFVTDIVEPNDIDNDEGIEVYSKITSKKNKTKTIWNGDVNNETL